MQGEAPLLYRLDDDPGETHDLAARESDAGMNAAAQRPIDKLARGTAVGLAGYCTFMD